MNETPVSPIEHLRGCLFQTIWTVCPEKKAEIDNIIREHNISLAFNDQEERIFFQADISNTSIIVGTKCLERLWAVSYCYFIFYDEMRTAKLNDPSTRSLDFIRNPKLQCAGQLLSWATAVDWQIMVEGKSRTLPLPPWPKDLPRPIADPVVGSDEDVADRMFLAAVGFILHHELAHIRLGHKPLKGVESVLQEKEADEAAANWLLSDLNEEDGQFIIRIIGIAIATVWLATLNIYVSHSLESTHPPSYDRLYQVLSRYVSDHDHTVWGIVCLALTAHLIARNVQYDDELVHESHKDAVNYFINIISTKTHDP